MAQSEEFKVEASASIWRDLGLKAFFRIVFKRWWLMFLVPVLFVVVVERVYKVTPETYYAELQIIPATMNTQFSKSGGLSALAGFDVGNLLGDISNDASFSVYTESWFLPWLSEELAKDQELMKRVFHKHWNEETNDWIEQANWKLDLKRKIYAFWGVEMPPLLEPGAEMLLMYIKGNVTVVPRKRTISTRVIAEHADVETAEMLLIKAHDTINKNLSTILSERAISNIEFLNQKLREVTSQEVRGSIVSEMQTQQRIEMLSFSNEEFAAQSLGVFQSQVALSPRLKTVVLKAMIYTMGIYIALLFSLHFLIGFIGQRFRRTAA